MEEEQKRLEAEAADLKAQEALALEQAKKDQIQQRLEEVRDLKRLI